MNFFKNFVGELVKEGHKVDIATNETNSKVSDYFKELDCHIYNISTSRSPFSLGNIKAIKQLKKIVCNYDLVHCHTPLAAMATRLACKKFRKKGLKVIYTAHGFHFYKGAPLKNWIIFYPIEKRCSKWTDALITINHEDYEFAKKKMKAKQIIYIPGVGIDVKKFEKTEVDISKKKEELGLPLDSKIILSVGELNENKNHQIVIKALGQLNDSNIHYVIAGKGDLKDKLEEVAKENNVNLHLLGFRTDVSELYKIADLYVLPSNREGLNVSIMEALASGCPVIASRIRGNVDMVAYENTFNPNCVEELVKILNGKPTIDSSFVEKADYSIINSTMLSIYKNFDKKLVK